MLISTDLITKAVRFKSTPASLSFKGQATKHTTVKWPIESAVLWATLGWILYTEKIKTNRVYFPKKLWCCVCEEAKHKNLVRSSIYLTSILLQRPKSHNNYHEQKTVCRNINRKWLHFSQGWEIHKLNQSMWVAVKKKGRKKIKGEEKG